MSRYPGMVRPDTAHKPASASFFSVVPRQHPNLAMENDETWVCASCGGEASTRCSRCKNTGYCDTNCQHKHWKEHKKACEDPDLDQYIHRAGKLLQDVFLVFAEKTYFHRIVRVEEKSEILRPSEKREAGKVLLVHQSHYDGDDKGGFYSIPDNLVSSDSDKKMILSTTMDDEVATRFYEFIEELMQGICTH
jgi:hypothetical protein